MRGDSEWKKKRTKVHLSIRQTLFNSMFNAVAVNAVNAAMLQCCRCQQNTQIADFAPKHFLSSSFFISSGCFFRSFLSFFCFFLYPPPSQRTHSNEERCPGREDVTEETVLCHKAKRI